MTSSQHGPYVRGYTHATMVGTKGCQAARWSESQKAGLSSDCRLQLACMKSESLVTADQLRCGEYCSRALYTPPVTSRKPGVPEVAVLTVRRKAPKV
jgi:hypothetical protein